MSIDSGFEGPPNGMGVVELIKFKQAAMRASGELVEDPGTAIFHFTFLSDPRYRDSLYFEEFQKLHLPEVTVEETKLAIIELGIKNVVETEFNVINPSEPFFLHPLEGRAAIAYTDGSTRVRYYFDPQNQHALKSFELHKIGQVHHELTHIARAEVVDERDNVLHRLVEEGIATFNEEHRMGNFFPTRKGHAYTEDDLVSKWKKLVPVFGDPMGTHRKQLLGPKNNPSNLIYSLGIFMVEKFMVKQPNMPIRELVRVPSQQILIGSGLPR